MKDFVAVITVTVAELVVVLVTVLGTVLVTVVVLVSNELSELIRLASANGLRRRLLACMDDSRACLLAPLAASPLGARNSPMAVGSTLNRHFKVHNI